VLKTPTVERRREVLADPARDETWSHEGYLAAVVRESDPGQGHHLGA
jgi:hypothetical protein